MSEEYISQDFDFLGSLRERLFGLSGFQTLALELIQNSEDAKAENMVFRFTEESLIVENSSTFRDVDFERMRKIGSGGKRGEEETIGTFGIGFVSVYQITDHPEIITSGKHWIFNPEEVTDRRIKSKSFSEKSNITKFIFPWAFENTEIRRKLEQSPIKKEDLMKYKSELIEIIPKSLIFLKKLSNIELYDGKKLIYKSTRNGNRDENYLETFANNKKELGWLMLRSSFEKNLFEEKKLNDVYIAVPKDIAAFKGILYIYLPSKIETNFPFHIQADFYPTPDRKAIITEGDEKAEWNRRAIKSIANLLASNVIKLRDELGVYILFKTLKSCKDYTNDSLFGEYWEILKPVISDSEIVLNSNDKWSKPDEIFILRSNKEEKLLGTLQKLNLKFVSPRLRSYYSILTEIGVREFKIEDLIKAIKEINLETGTELDINSYPIDSREHLIDIYKEFNVLIDNEDDEVIEEIESLVIGLSINGKLHRISVMRRLNEDERNIFFFLKDKIIIADELGLNSDKVINLIPRLSIEDIITELSKLSKEDLELFRTEKVNFIKIYEYFADNEKQFKKNPDLIKKLKKIPMFLAHDEFKALDDLSLPGSFNDPLKLDILIQGPLNGKITHFLEDIIGVEKLDLLTYCKHHLPRILDEWEIPIEENRILVDELIANFSKLKDHPDIIKKLGECDIIECEDGLVRAAEEVYFDSDILENIFKDKEFHIVSYPQVLNDSSKDFYKFLGVTETPRARDIIQCINEIISQPPDVNNIKTIERFFYFLNNKWEIFEKSKEEFDILKTINWLPCEGNANKWFKSNELFSNYRKYLFASQAKFIQFSKPIAKEFAKFLELKTEPNIQQVIDHLLYCSAKSIDVNPEVYNFLSQKIDNNEINQLSDKKCINTLVNKYLFPYQVFWLENPFGKYRFLLNETLKKYYDLFKKIGVKDKPNVNDYISIIEDISNKFGNQNEIVDEESLTILNNCFIFLQNFSKENKINENILLSLRNKKIIPQCDNLLYKPEHLFFEDKPNMAKKFGNRIIKNIIIRDTSNYSIFEKLGVRFLSNGIKKEVSLQGKIYSPKYTLFIKSFKLPLLRIIENRKRDSPDGWNEKILDDIEVFEVVELMVKYGLKLADNLIVESESISEPVYFSSEENIFYIKKGEKINSRLFAKEFALALNSELDTSDLSPLISEILNSKDPSDAEKILDEYDIGSIIKSVIENVEPGEVIDSIGNQNEEKIKTEYESQDNKEDENYDDLYGFDSLQKQSENNSGFKLRSYVLPPNSKDSMIKKDPFISQEEINRIDRAGVEKVLKYEMDNGRHPIEMSHSNEGYDIESINSNGDLERFIEVKSTRKKWNGFEVELSDSQFFKAQDEGIKYYLYVVDQVFSDDCRIYEINNPANKATGFLFDSAWKDS